MTRAECAVMIWNILGQPPPGAPCPFSDVAPGTYYHDAVTALSRMGIVSGIGGGLFNPGGRMSREMGMAIQANTYGITPESAETYRAFTDHALISEWARPYLSAMLERGYVEGVGGGRCAPGYNMTRAELIALSIKVYDGENA